MQTSNIYIYIYIYIYIVFSIACFINFSYQVFEKISDNNKKLPNPLIYLFNTYKMYNRIESNFKSKQYSYIDNLFAALFSLHASATPAHCNSRQPLSQVWILLQVSYTQTFTMAGRNSCKT